MRNPRVHWHQGLFLRPHHLQAADRHWDELAQLSHQWDSRFHYGLHEMQFSTEAIENGHFEVYSIKARMRDSTLVSLELGEESNRVDLSDALQESQPSLKANLADAFEQKTVVDVYLAVPHLKMGRANVGSPDENSDTRYREANVSLQDESRGGDDQEIQFRTLNTRLLLSTEDCTGYETLPIARIKRAGVGAAVPALDKDYIPPVLSIDAWLPLGREIVRAIYDLLGQKVEVLSKQLTDRGIGLSSQDPGDADRIMMLTQLNEAYGVLSLMAFTPGSHPLTVYTELCRIASQLAIFSPQRRAVSLPPYDHEDLAGIFKQIKARIEQYINAVQDYEFEQRHFVGVGMGMQATLEPHWFHSDWQWFIGVRKGDLTFQEIRDLLSPGQLDWKIGSSRQVEMLFQQGAEGVQVESVDRVIRALPVRQDWIYYEVVGHDTPAWRDVQQTQTLALRLKDTLILNREQLQGETQLVVSAGGKRVTLQFALFAVPEGP